MPAIACPITGCTYMTPAEHPIDVAVTLLNLHGKDHDSNPTSKPDKVKRPVISSSGTTISNQDGQSTRELPISQVLKLRSSCYASQCKFNVECTYCNRVISYMDLILKDHIIHGLSNQEIQLEVLAHQNQDMNLESLVKLIEAKESGRRSAHRLHDSTNTGNTTTTAAAASAQWGLTLHHALKMTDWNIFFDIFL